MKVYIVTAGEYSDYHICKVFLDKEKAEKYVALENELNKGCWDECYINEWDTADDSIKMEAKVAHYYYCYINNEGEIETDEEYADETEPMIDKGITIVKPDEWGIAVYSQKSFKHAKKVAIEHHQRITQMKLELGL